MVLPALDVHTPQSAFVVGYSIQEGTIQGLFATLQMKARRDFIGYTVGVGWVKYEWNKSIWDLDDDTDYMAFASRNAPSADNSPSPSPAIFLHNPAKSLPEPPAYQNMCYYIFRSRGLPPTPASHGVVRTLSAEALDILAPLPKRRKIESGIIEAKIRMLWRQPICVKNKMELISHLAKPLEPDEKVPVSQKKFDAMLGQYTREASNLLDSYGLGTIWRVSQGERAPHLTMTTTMSVIENTPPSSGTEPAFIRFWDTLIDKNLHIAQTGETFRDSNQNMSTGLKRPDYGFCLRGHCLFRGEEKSPGSKIDPKNELLQKLKWSYDPLPFILGYAAVGRRVELIMISKPPCKITVLATHDLAGVQERINCFVHILRISAILAGLAAQLAPRTVQFLPIERPNGVFIEIGEGMVKKRFTENIYQSLRHHEDIYKELKQKNVRYTDQCLKVHDDYILTSPVGDSQPPGTGKAAYMAITCILKALMKMHAEPSVYHRDIRRENIIKRIDSDDWFLIDFADACKVPTKAANHLNRENHSPHIRQDGHGAEVDIWGVAHYMCQLLRVVNNRQYVEQMAIRWKGDTTLTAEMALGEIEQAKQHFFTEVAEPHHIAFAETETNDDPSS